MSGDGLPGTRSRVVTSPQPTVTGSITLEVDELELLLQRASEKGAIKGAEAAKLRTDVRTGAEQSQTISSLTAQLRNARWIIGMLVGLAGSVGGIAGAFAKGYQDRKTEILEPIVVAEAKAERAAVKADGVSAELAVRLDAADARVTVLESNLGALKDALDANTRAVLGIAAKLDAEPEKGRKGR